MNLYYDQRLPLHWILEDDEGLGWLVPANEHGWEQRQPIERHPGWIPLNVSADWLRLTLPSLGVRCPRCDAATSGCVSLAKQAARGVPAATKPVDAGTPIRVGALVTSRAHQPAVELCLGSTQLQVAPEKARQLAAWLAEAAAAAEMDTVLLRFVIHKVGADETSAKGPAPGFGWRLRALRQARMLTQRTLAERVKARLQAQGGRGFDVTYLSKIENGKVGPPSSAAIIALGEELGTDVDELIALAGKVPPALGDTLKASQGARMFSQTAVTLGLTEPDWQHLLEEARRLVQERTGLRSTTAD